MSKYKKYIFFSQVKLSLSVDVVYPESEPASVVNPASAEDLRDIKAGVNIIFNLVWSILNMFSEYPDSDIILNYWEQKNILRAFVNVGHHS